MTAVEINKQIGRWLEGLRQSDAADTLVDVGIHYGELGRRRALAEFLAATGRTPTTHATIPWNVNPTDWSHIIDRWDASRLAEPFAFTNEAPLRLGVAPHTPKSVMPRMLQAPSVGSVFVDVGRAKNALRRRPWQWPLRIATLGMDAVATAVLHHEIEDRDMFPAQLLQLHRAEDEPAAVDVLLVVGPLRRAVERVVVNRGPVANGVIVFDVDHSWVHPRSAVQTLRTVTGAVVVALHPDSNVADVTSELIRGMSHAQPFDIALTTATDGHAMLIGERAGLDRADLPHIARRMVHEAVMVRSEVAMTADRRFDRDRPGDILPPQPPFLEGFEDGLLDISRGPFLHEGDEATVVADHHSVFEQQVHAHETEQRWLQASLAHPKRPGEAATLKSGLNHVAVFIGPLERGAAHAPEPFDDAALPWDEEDAEAFRLTVAFVPLYPEGKAQTKQLDLPRVGASRRIVFRWTVRQPGEDGNEPFTPLARILVLFRNRVLQTTVVNGSIGEPIRLTETVSLRPHLGHLDERRAFDVAFFTNHDNRNVPRVIRVSSRQVVFSKMDTFEGIIDQLSAILGATVNMLNTPAGLGDERVRALLIELAGKGRDLYAELGTLGQLGEAKRIQVVSARTTSFLPVELAYERHAPHGDARICDGFMAGKTRCDDTCPAAEDRSVVCPNAFIGMGRVIERISYDPQLEPKLDGNVLVRVAPRAKSRRLSVDHAAVATSSNVRQKDVSALVEGLGQGSVHPATWDEWVEAIADADLDLLVLLPHTEYLVRGSYMEIGKSKLERGMLESEVVRRNDKLKPAVVLFGCKTSGTLTDRAGFANRFLDNGAAVVFGSLTMLLGRHAAALAGRLARQMRDAEGSHQSIGEVLSKFRRDAVGDGMLAVLAVTAYGDADWTL